MSESSQYFKDRLKRSIHNKLSGEGKKLKTSMQTLLMQLRAKDLLPEKIKAVELFGMHALWHTLDYVKYVDSLDIFEINKRYHEQSKKVLRKYNVRYFNEDSIKFASQTNEKYNLIVADIPFSGPFYDEHGLPLFFSDMIRISEGKSALIINIHTERLKQFKKLEQIIAQKSSPRTLSDLFFVPKNDMVSYMVVCLE